MTGWGWAALLAGGTFTSAVMYFAVVRVPRWRAMEIPVFLPDFARAINVADKVQPALLVATIASGALMLGAVEGTSALLTAIALAGFGLVLIGSLSFLVPLQRRMIRLGPDAAMRIDEMRARWLKGHLGRALLAVTSFAVLVLAVAGA